MKQEVLFNQKKEVAKRTIAMKTKIHGFKCEVEEPEQVLQVYGEESGHIKYQEAYKTKLLISNSTQENMKTSTDLLNSTENADLFLVMYEEDILPRNSRIKVYMQDDCYRQLEVRDNNKNEGTFIIHQELVPCNNTVDTTLPEVGRNLDMIEEDTEDTDTSEGDIESTSIGANL